MAGERVTSNVFNRVPTPGGRSTESASTTSSLFNTTLHRTHDLVSAKENDEDVRENFKRGLEQSKDKVDFLLNVCFNNKHTRAISEDIKTLANCINLVAVIKYITVCERREIYLSNLQNMLVFRNPRGKLVLNDELIKIFLKNNNASDTIINIICAEISDSNYKNLGHISGKSFNINNNYRSALFEDIYQGLKKCFNSKLIHNCSIEDFISSMYMYRYYSTQEKNTSDYTKVQRFIESVCSSNEIHRFSTASYVFRNRRQYDVPGIQSTLLQSAALSSSIPIPPPLPPNLKLTPQKSTTVNMLKKVGARAPSGILGDIFSKLNLEFKQKYTQTTRLTRGATHPLSSVESFQANKEIEKKQQRYKEIYMYKHYDISKPSEEDGKLLSKSEIEARLISMPRAGEFKWSKIIPEKFGKLPQHFTWDELLECIADASDEELYLGDLDLSSQGIMAQQHLVDQAGKVTTTTTTTLTPTKINPNPAAIINGCSISPPRTFLTEDHIKFHREKLAALSIDCRPGAKLTKNDIRIKLRINTPYQYTYIHDNLFNNLSEEFDLTQLIQSMHKPDEKVKVPLSSEAKDYHRHNIELYGIIPNKFTNNQLNMDDITKSTFFIGQTKYPFLDLDKFCTLPNQFSLDDLIGCMEEPGTELLGFGTPKNMFELTLILRRYSQEGGNIDDSTASSDSANWL